ncbi:MAG TPA: hypothetical protein VGR96_11365 [Acidobacteriaceae bacterium]|nr:hypothetical protein [Acidobacteriaceae bacterium]
MSRWDLAFWAAGAASNLLLILVLFLRGRYRSFPWFTALVTQDLVQTILLYLIHVWGSADWYFYAYWGFEMLDALLRIVVIWELSRYTARQLGLQEVKEQKMFQAALYGLTVAATLVVLFLVPGLPNHLLETIALKGSLFASILIGGLITCQFVGVFCMGVRFRAHIMALSVGLWFYHLAELFVICTILMSDIGFWPLLERCIKPVYLICLLTWSVLLWLDEPKQYLSQEMARLLFPKGYPRPSSSSARVTSMTQPSR